MGLTAQYDAKEANRVKVTKNEACDANELTVVSRGVSEQSERVFSDLTQTNSDLTFQSSSAASDGINDSYLVDKMEKCIDVFMSTAISCSLEVFSTFQDQKCAHGFEVDLETQTSVNNSTVSAGSCLRIQITCTTIYTNLRIHHKGRNECMLLFCFFLSISLGLPCFDPEIESLRDNDHHLLCVMCCLC